MKNMQSLRLLRSLLSRQVGRRNYAGHAHDYVHDYPVTTLSDLPQPQGSWKTQHDANQRKYNAQMVAGFAALVGTILFGKAVGFLEFHNDIPKRPADIPSYK